MDPITAGFALAQSIITFNQTLFEALGKEEKAARAKEHFDGLQRVQEFIDKVLSIFHPKD